MDISKLCKRLDQAADTVEERSDDAGRQLEDVFDKLAEKLSWFKGWGKGGQRRKEEKE